MSQICFIILDLFINFSSINLCTNSAFNFFCKFFIRYKLFDSHYYIWLNSFFHQLCGITAWLSSLLAFPTAYIIKSFIIFTIFVCPCVLICVHRTSTNRTLQYSSKQVCPIPSNFWRCFDSSSITLYFCLIPIFYTDNGFMLTIYQNVIICFYLLILILCAFYFLPNPSAICQLATIDRIVYQFFNSFWTPLCKSAILSNFLFNSLQIQIFCNTIISHISIDEFIKYNPDCIRFIFCYEKFIVFQFIAIWSKTTIPTTLSCLFSSPVHGLLYNILSFNLRNRWQYRNK